MGKTFKTLFSSFRNALISTICAIAVLAAAGTGIALAAGAGKPKEAMDRNRALEYAFADAGVQGSEVTITKQKLEKESGKQHYDIEFYNEEYEYEYEIDAFTGAVTGVEIQARNIAALSDAGGTAGLDRPNGSGQSGEGTRSDGTGESGEGTRPDGTGESGEGTRSDGTDESGEGTRSDGTGESGEGTRSDGTDESGEGTRPDGTGESGEGTQSNGTGESGEGPQSNGTGQQGQNNEIDMETAKATALSDAGVSGSDVVFVETKLDWEDGIRVYDIEFYAGGNKYKYEIAVSSGIIVDKDIELSDAPVYSAQNGLIDMETAKATALSDAGVSEADAVFTKSELDWDDGAAVYEFEFRTASAEYEYEINASDGSVLNREMEAYGRHDPVPGTEGGNASAYIGVDQAKAIALDHAGLDTDDVVFTKTKLEREHGRIQYEIEFYKGLMEYEYSIDAYTGDILEHESEYDD